MLHRDRDVLAIVGARRYHLAPHLHDRPDADLERRTVDAMCLLLIARRPAPATLDLLLWPCPN